MPAMTIKIEIDCKWWVQTHAYNTLIVVCISQDACHITTPIQFYPSTALPLLLERCVSEVSQAWKHESEIDLEDKSTREASGLQTSSRQGEQTESRVWMLLS